MKTTDFAILFVAILLPIIVVVYVDISLLLKKEEQTLYYKNVIDSAINDATYAMKNVEGQDIDYGYSGISQNRVSVNANVAVDTFFESLNDNFEIKGDVTSEEYIKSHIPALAVVDYNGVYIYSLDTYKDSIDYMLKPKRYFTYSYAISEGEVVSGEELMEEGKLSTTNKIYTVIFTMDDYIGLIGEDSVIDWFYLEDNKNNIPLYTGNESKKEQIIQHLKLKRTEVISNIVSEEMSFAVSNHNIYSEVDYEFTFPSITVSDWEEMINNVGIIAFLQGINIGNVKLDYVAHGISGLKLTERYYVSIETKDVSKLNYYHNNSECSVYLTSDKSFTGYYMNKVDAATNGYYPCPICKP